MRPFAGRPRGPARRRRAAARGGSRPGSRRRTGSRTAASTRARASGSRNRVPEPGLTHAARHDGVPGDRREPQGRSRTRDLRPRNRAPRLLPRHRLDGSDGGSARVSPRGLDARRRRRRSARHAGLRTAPGRRPGRGLDREPAATRRGRRPAARSSRHDGRRCIGRDGRRRLGDRRSGRLRAQGAADGARSCGRRGRQPAREPPGQLTGWAQVPARPAAQRRAAAGASPGRGSPAPARSGAHRGARRAPPPRRHRSDRSFPPEPLRQRPRPWPR